MNTKLISLFFSTLLGAGTALAAVPGPEGMFNQNALWPTPDINGYAVDGLTTRGVLYFDMQNDLGAIDRLSEAWAALCRGRDLSDCARSELSQVLATAKVLAGDINPVGTVSQWLEANMTSPYRADMKLLKADLLLEQGQLGEAFRTYSEIDVDALSPNLRDDYLYHSAYTHLRLANYVEAKDGFEDPELLKSKDYGNAARFYSGYVYYIDRDYPAALQAWENVNTATMPGKMADYYKAQIAYYDGNYDKALQIARPLTDNTGVPSMFTAEANRIVGEAYYQKGEAARAIPYLKKYVEECETPEPSAQYILGLSYYEDGRYQKAVDTLTPVTADHSAMGQSAYLYIGQSLLKLGDDNSAIIAFNRALTMDVDPKVTEVAYYNYAVAKSRGGGVPFASSVVTFEEFLSKYPDSRFADSVAGYIVTGYVTDGNYEAALNSINKVSHPSESILAAKQKVLYMLGAKQLAAGATPKAVNTLKEAKKLSRYDEATGIETDLVLGEALYRTGQYEESATELLEYLDRAPATAANRPLALYDLGYTRLAQQEWSKAQLNFERMIASPGNMPQNVIADANARLGDARYYQRNWNGAASAYDNAYRLNPAQGDYPLYQKALMQGYNRDYTGKIETLDKMSDEFPSSPLLPDALLEQAEAYTQLKDPAKARARYQELIENYSQTKQGRQAYLYLAASLAGGGNTDKAIATYQELIRQSANSDEARLANEAVKRLHAEQGTLNQYAEFVENVNGIPAMDTVEAETLSWNAAEHAYLEGKGVKLLEKYTKEYPSGIYAPRAYAYLLDNSEENGDEGDSYRYASLIVSRYPDNAAVEQALIVKADIDYDRGRGLDALHAWEMLEKKASTPENKNIARLGIMRVARDTGDAARMRSAADALLQSSALGADEKTEASFSRGLSMSLSGDTDSAVAVWKELAGNTDDLYGAKAAVYAAEALNVAGDYEEASKIAEVFVNSGTPHTYWLARGFIALADAYTGRGRQFEAREYIKALKENYPGKETDIFEMIEQRLK